jgi:hypothetical protein
MSYILTLQTGVYRHEMSSCSHHKMGMYNYNSWYIYICINITWDTLHIIFIITIGQMASFETSGIQSLNTGCTAIGFELLRNLDLAGGHSRLCGHGFSFDSSTCYSVHSHCGYMLSLLKDILKKISVWSSKPHGFGRFEEFVDVYMSNSQSNTYDTHSVFFP